uniref:Titin n=1 Tax=Esox lucius TaxID=8010 RepID=A0A3P8ZW39_ESOLU
MKASFTNIIDTVFTVLGLTEGGKYDFRVVARNAAGSISKPSESTGSITTKDEVDPPKCEVDSVYNQVVVVNAGETFTLEASVQGKPIPTAQWFKSEALVENTARAEIMNSDFQAKLVVKDSIRVDGGQYTLLLTNVAGEKSVTFNVRVLDRPGPPEGPLTVSNVTCEKCSLSWLPPRADGGKYKVQICAINKLGVGEPAEVLGTIKPVDAMFAPEIELNSELRKGVVVRAGGSMRINIPFKGRPIPEISWSKDEGDLTNKVQIEKGTDFTQLSIDICDRNDAGKYTLTLANSSGSKSAFVSVKVLDTPGAPVNLTVKDIKKNSVYLVWEPPIIDGGARVKNYYVEKRESTRQAYSNISNKCVRNSFHVGDLIEGAIYYFRVMAENEYGVGLAAETEDPVKTSEIPLPVGKITLTEVTKKTASMAWEKPDHDGGSRIIGYYIEMLPAGSEEWILTTTTKTCEGTVEGLTAGQEYQFRISAFNDKGKSDTRVLAAPVTARDLTIEPSFVIAFNTFSVQHGEDLKIEIPVRGRPEPKVVWTKDGHTIKETTRLNVSRTPSSTILAIREATRDDSGKYKITATNSIGEKFAEIRVIILEKPGPVTGPIKIEEVSSNYVNLAWEPPVYTGGCQINNYVVEKRDTTTVAWQCVSATVARTTIKVTNLKTGTEYQFRVFAENRYGKSPAVDSAAVVVQYPFSEPLAPGTPFVSSVTKDHMIVEWKAPTSNGGSPIIGYHLERKEKNSILWTKLNKMLIPDCHYKTSELEEGIEYEFKVFAENIAGLSPPSKISDVCVARDPCDPPGTPEAIDITRNHVTLSWTRPQYDGGSLITGYVVERKKLPDVEPRIQAISYKVTKLLPGNEYIFRVTAVNKFGVGEPLESDPVIAHIDGYVLEKRDKDGVRWTKCNKKRLNDIRFRCTGLTEGHWYEFRVSAENAAGVGVPSAPTAYIKACDATYPPGPPSNPKVTDQSSTTVSLLWTRPIYDGGAAIKGYVVEMREKGDEEWITCTPPTGVQETHFTVKKLRENTEYYFRICAINIEGVGEHVDVPGSVVASEKLEAPEIELDSDLRKIVQVRASATLRLFVTIKGRPEPEVKWSKMDGTLTERAQIEVTSSYTMLVIDNVNRFDTGKYVLTLENNSGQKSAFINVRVLDSPSAPENFEVKDIKRDSVSLSWEPPLIDGGAKITHYIVEKRDTTRLAFTTLEATIGGLTSGEEYSFRIIAVNDKGKSEPKPLAYPVIVKDLTIEPIIDLMFNTYSVKAGDDLKINVPFRGRPEPEVTWKKDGAVLKQTTRVNVLAAKNSSKITIKDATREDFGKYEITLTNAIGKASATISVIILDKPGPPGAIKYPFKPPGVPTSLHVAHA